MGLVWARHPSGWALDDPSDMLSASQIVHDWLQLWARHLSGWALAEIHLLQEKVYRPVWFRHVFSQM